MVAFSTVIKMITVHNTVGFRKPATIFYSQQLIAVTFIPRIFVGSDNF